MKYVYALRNWKKTGIISSGSAELLTDFHTFLGIVSHPLVLKYKADEQNKKQGEVDDSETDDGDDESTEQEEDEISIENKTEQQSEDSDSDTNTECK